MISRVSLGLAFFLGTFGPSSADMLWGANGHPLTAYPGISVSQQLDYLKDLGMTSYRVNVPDLGKLPALTSLVKEAKARGIEILPVITPSNLDLDKESTEALYEKARDLAISLASPFKNDIRVWELGNEMENYAIIQPCEKRDDGSTYPCEWGPAGGVGPLEYFGPRWAKVSAVLKGLSDGVTSVDPDIRKAIGTAGWGHLGAFERMQDDGIDWDISVWHAYGEDPQWAFDTLKKYKKPIWLTEFNNPYGSQRSESQQAEGLRQTMARLKELQNTHNLEAAFVYELLDEPYWAPNFEAYMGLVKVVPKKTDGWTPGEPKLAYFTVRDMIRGPKLFSTPTRNCDLASTGNDGSLVERQVSYAYCLVLGRDADNEGLESWANTIGSGTTDMPGMLLTMATSEEFRSRYALFGLSNPAFVNFLYHMLLNREADPIGLATYVKELNTGAMSRWDIAYGMIGSSEFKSKHPALFLEKATASQTTTQRG
ncbi:MAG: DUF4214 domain-containing protein [Phyllobacterium sp.]